MGVSPVRHPTGPRKRGLAFKQAELVTHPGPPGLGHEPAGQLSTVRGHMSPEAPWPTGEGGHPKAPALTQDARLLSKQPGAGGGVQRLLWDSGLLQTPSSSESSQLPPSPEPCKWPRLGPVHSSCLWGR